VLRYVPKARLNHDDEPSFILGTFANLNGSAEGGTCRNAGEESFLTSETTAISDRIIIGNDNYFIDQLNFENLRNKTRANSLNFMGPGRPPEVLNC
jgi:hypothetical protein